VRFLITSSDKTTFDSGLVGGGASRSLNAGSISPDGRKIAFTARDEAGKVMLWVRALDAITAQSLPGTENAGLPFWSPDSKSIGFFASRKLRKIGVEGGPAQTICDAQNGRGGTWNREGVIVFAPAPSTSLLRVSASGGEPLPVTKLQSGEIDHRFPSFLPDGKHFLYGAIASGENSSLVFAGSLDTLQAQRLLATDSPAIYALPGYLLFVRQGTLLAQPFDAKKLELTGESIPVAKEVAFEGNARGFSTSENGTLEYRVGASSPQYQLVWADRGGKVIESAGVPALYQSPAISPDGKRIAVHRHDGNGGDIWVMEASGGKMSRLTFDASQENSQPVWSADGSRIVFGSRRNNKWGIYQKLSNGTGTEELLFESDVLKMPMSWSTAANTVLFYVQDPKSGTDVWALPLAGDRKPLPLLQTAFNESHPQISPDGKWFAYTSNETGRAEIYVQSFPPGGGKWQVSSNGGVFARWRPDGKELFYMERPSFSKVVAVAIHPTGSTFEFSPPRPLFDSGYLNNAPGHTGGNYNTFDVSSDGQRFVIPRPEATDITGALANTPITVVLNWTAALSKK
jgi:Tol biopolymer transport system component